MARAATTSDPFNAIAEQGRRDILDALGPRELSVADIVERVHLTQPQVSKHLSVLRAVGLVRSRPMGKQRLYRVDAAPLRPIHEWAGRFERQWNARLDRFEDVLHELDHE